MSVEMTSESNVVVENYTYTWLIEGFNQLPFVSEHPVYTSCISLGPGEDRLWQLCMSKQYNDDDEPSIGFRLARDSDYDDTYYDTARYSISLKCDDGTIEKVVTDDIVGLDNEFKAFLYADKKNFSKDIFQEKNMTVVCHITFTYVTNVGDADVDELEEEFCMSKAQIAIFNSKNLYDAILVADDKEFFVHMCFLKVRGLDLDQLVEDGVVKLESAVNGVVENGVKEGSSVVKYHISVDPATLDMLMTYLYTGSFSHCETVDDYAKLLKLAVMLRMTRLQRVCELELRQIKKLVLCKNCNENAKHEDILKCVVVC